jgi:putative transposase
VTQDGAPGLLRIPGTRGKWIAQIACTLLTPGLTSEPGIRGGGVDLGVKLPAVSHVAGRGTRYLGNGRYQPMMRRRYGARRKQLQQAGKVRAGRKSPGTERRGMCDVNHKLSRQIVNCAHAQGVGTIRREQLAGMRQRTARTSRGARCKLAPTPAAIATWSCYQLGMFRAHQAERLGMRVEQVAPAYTSQTCPACCARNTAHDRRYICAECGWTGPPRRSGRNHSQSPDWPC